MKKLVYLLLITVFMFLVMGCKKNDKDVNEQNDINPTKKITPTEKAESTPTPEAENHEGKMKSYLSGNWVPEEVGNKRPYALQLSNFKKVSNQWGISSADIIYEALVEGGITRLLAIGESFTEDRLGSIRSSRHYFASIAEDYNAIYVHFGKTKYAVTKLKELNSDNLDGGTGVGTIVFYRDNTMKAPHNAFASIDGIMAGIESKGYSIEYDQDFEPNLRFNDEDTDLPGEDLAKNIKIGFSNYTSPSFEYNEKDKLYYRYQFNGPHIDSNTGEQLKFKNLIIQYVKQRPIDRNDYQTIDFEDASGKGVYISNGKQIPITWERNEKTGYMRFFTEDGQNLLMNQGKTFITLFPNDRINDVVIEG